MFVKLTNQKHTKIQRSSELDVRQQIESTSQFSRAFNELRISLVVLFGSLYCTLCLFLEAL